MLEVTLPSREGELELDPAEEGVMTVSTEPDDAEDELDLDPEIDRDEVDDVDSVMVVLEMTNTLYVEVEINELDDESEDDRDAERLLRELVRVRVAFPPRLDVRVRLELELEALKVDTVKLLVKVVVDAKTPVLKAGV